MNWSAIVTALKRESSIRVSCGSRWLVWDGREWVVYEKSYGQRGVYTIVMTECEEEAVAALTAS